MARSQDEKKNSKDAVPGNAAAAADKPGRAADTVDIRQKLARRMVFAGVMIVALLGGLALFDNYSAQPEVEPVAKTFSEPVPVGKKVTTQPVTPVDPEVTKPPESALKASEPEASAAPSGKGAPPPPEVAARPSPSSAPRTAVTAPIRAALPGSAQPVPTPAANAAPNSASASATATSSARQADTKTAPVPVTRSEPATTTNAPSVPATPAPARLFSGFALQAGVFAEPRRAEELLARLTEAGIPASIESRVQVGPFKSRAEAEAAHAKLRALGIDAILLPPRDTRR